MRVVATGRGVDVRVLSPQTCLVEDLGFDSLDAAEMLATLHSETGAQIDAPSLTELRTIDDVAEALTKETT